MIIKNDAINFEAADIQLLSAGLQQALIEYVGPIATPPEDFLSQLCNSQLQTALKIAAKANTDALTAIAVALVTADPATKQSALASLDQASATLGLSVKPAVLPEPLMEPPVSLAL